MSLPVKSLSLAPSFVVNGKSLQLHLPRPLTPLPTRKIYNPKYFFNDSYQHEIANHYRDYKRRPRLSRLSRRRRHTRTLYVPYRRAAFYGVVSGERRSVLPMAVHDFPRFTAVYTTPRGRQTLCEDEPPDETYNATVRRIRQANTQKELKKLFERQLRLSACRKSGATNYCKERQTEGEKFHSAKAAKWVVEVEPTKAKRTNSARADVNVCEKWCDCNNNADDNNDVHYVDKSNVNESLRKVKSNEVRRLTCSKQQKDKQKITELQIKPKQTPTTSQRQLTRDCHIELSTSGQKVKPKNFRQCNKNQFRSNSKLRKKESPEEAQLKPNSLAHYLHLACEYYEQGYLRNITYLQTIGVRNVARRNQLKLIAQAAPRAPSNSSNDEPVTAATVSANTSTTNTPSPTPRRVSDYFRLTRLLRRIGRKRSFKVDTSTSRSSCSKRTTQTKAPTVKPVKDESARENPLGIRVNIKPCAYQTVKAELKLISSASLASQLLEASKSSAAPPVPEPHAHSMNIYLNANLSTTTSTTTNLVSQQQQQTSTNTAEATATTTTPVHFHDLVDHFMQLDISDIDKSSLPKITLTDFSSSIKGASPDVDNTTTTQTNENAFAFEFNTNFTTTKQLATILVPTTSLTTRN